MTDTTMTLTYSDGKGGTISTGPFSDKDMDRAVAAIRQGHQAQRKKEGKPPMKPDPDFDAAAEGSYRVTASELRALVERIERLEIEKKEIADQIREVFAEAKGRGYDTKIMRKIIALRKREPDDIAEEEAVLEMYKEALGMR